MNQIKTGLFIKEMRKAKNLTQRELAEKLNISEKTVSKLETGNGLPEVSLMLPLCDLLGISVNELLSGEKLSTAEYVRKAEENMVSLMTDKTRPKTKIIIATISFILTFLFVIATTLYVGFTDMPTWFKILIIALAYAMVFAQIFMCVLVAVSVEIFECSECGKQFVPTLSAYILGPHTFTRRYLKCPYCGKKRWNKSNLRK